MFKCSLDGLPWSLVWYGLVPSWSHSIIIIIPRGASLLISSFSSTEDDLWPPPLLVISRSIQSSSGRFFCCYFLVTDSWVVLKLSFLLDLAQNVFFHSLWAGYDRRQCDKDLWSWSNGQKVDIYDGQSERQCSALDTLSTKDKYEDDDITWIEQHSHNQSNRLILLFVVHFHCS